MIRYALKNLRNLNDLFHAKPWFLCPPERLKTFQIFVNQILCAPVRVLICHDGALLSRASPEAFTRWQQEAKKHIETLQLPIERRELACVLAERMGLSLHDCELLLQHTQLSLLWDGNQLVGTSLTRNQRILAALRSSDRPLSVIEIEQQFGRASCQNASYLATTKWSHSQRRSTTGNAQKSDLTFLFIK